MTISPHLRWNIVMFGFLVGLVSILWLTFHQPPRTHMDALDRIIGALKARDEGAIRALTTKRGFEDLKNAASGYFDRGPGLAGVLKNEARLIRRDNAWQMIDANHASAGTRHKGGSGMHDDHIDMVRSDGRWKLERYWRMYLDGPSVRAK